MATSLATRMALCIGSTYRVGVISTRLVAVAAAASNTLMSRVGPWMRSPQEMLWKGPASTALNQAR